MKPSHDQPPSDAPATKRTPRSKPAGARFLEALTLECPLQIVGTINPLTALLAEQAGFRAIYLSGAGVANASHALPDLGFTHLDDVLEDARRITAATTLPLLVDIDTGWGTEGSIQRAIRELQRAGVAAVHLEDQVAAKRCGHRPGKQLVDTAEMLARIRAAVAARQPDQLLIMARTDAVVVEGLEPAIERARAYIAAGADMIFAEAVERIEDYARFTSALNAPVLANLTEFGRTPSFDLEQLRSAGIRMALYPLTAFRAMNEAARRTYHALRRDGHAQSIMDQLQTRDQLYALLNYHVAEQQIELGRNA